MAFAGQYRPAGHITHCFTLLNPCFIPKVPIGHGSGTAIARGQKYPKGHSEGAIVPSFGHVLPPGHCKQSAKPVKFEYIPAGHGYGKAEASGQ